MAKQTPETVSLDLINAKIEMLEIEEKKVESLAQKKWREISKVLGEISNTPDLKTKLYPFIKAECQKELSLETRNNTLTAENNRLTLELTKTQDLNVKLQNLGRELQRAKQVAEAEGKRLALEEQKKGLSLCNQFQGSLDSITERLKIESEQFEKTQKINEQLVKSIEEQRDREDKIFLALQAKEAEVKLLQTRVQDSADQIYQFRSLTKVYKEKLDFYESREKEFESVQSLYAEKIGVFQEGIAKTTETLKSYKKELDSARARINQLEKTNEELTRNQINNGGLIADLALKNKKLTEEFQNALLQKVKLEEICRGLQKTIKEVQITAPASNNTTTTNNNNSSNNSGNEKDENSSNVTNPS